LNDNNNIAFQHILNKKQYNIMSSIKSIICYTTTNNRSLQIILTFIDILFIMIIKKLKMLDDILKVTFNLIITRPLNY